VLEAVYEQDFLPCSYGFRPGRSAHPALQSLYTACMRQRLRWVLDIDIVKYFDSIPHSHLRDFLDQRVTDGVIRRMIDKWLKAGVLEDGLLHHATEGSPQGGVISPCLSNIFLHHVLDEWFETEVRPRLKGGCTPQGSPHFLRGRGNKRIVDAEFLCEKNRGGRSDGNKCMMCSKRLNSD
jgi:RNA-directed DNA polymerase